MLFKGNFVNTPSVIFFLPLASNKQVYLAYLTTLPLETRQKEWNDFKKTINMLEVLEIDEEVTVIQHSALNIEFIDNLGNKLAERQTSPKLGYDKWWKKFHDLAFSKG